MKKITYKTIGGRCHSQLFCETNFFEFFLDCLEYGMEIENSVSLYLNNINEAVHNADIPFDSVLPESIEYEFDKEFQKRYCEINDMLKFNI